MSTAPALRDEHVRDMTIPDPKGTGNAASAVLVEWAEGLAAAHRIASALCVTAFAPAHFKNKPEEAAAAILYGAEIGFTPTQALQNLYVIGGKPAMYARPMVALVQGAGHDVWTEEKSDESVTVCGRRRGSEHVTRETWTTARAQRAGYTSNKKYQTDPQAMLYARAASDVCRQIAADVLAGIGYTVEEMQLTEPDEEAKAKPRGMSAVRAAVKPEPDPEPQADEVTGEVVEEPSKAATAQMFALFGERDDMPDGRTTEGRAYRLDYCSQVLGREVASSKDLSADDVSAIIDQLQADAAAPDEGDPWAGGEQA